MAKNITKQTTEPYAVAEYEGHFTGDLTGNADTASALKNPFTVTLTGDGTGNFTTSGQSTTLNLKVQHSDQSSRADYAITAGSVTSAAQADSAEYADYAALAGTADHAATADRATSAQSAVSAGTATEAGHAVSAESAEEADHAVEADHATEADHALRADEATTLVSNATVPKAEYAEKANLATIAQYDCKGRSITDFYALKVELPTDYMPRNEAEALFVSQSELPEKVVMTGKAFGEGFRDGSVLRVNVTSVATDGSFYDSLVWGAPDANSDTTKVYLDSRHRLYFYDLQEQKWQVVTADYDLSPVTEAIKEYKTSTDNKISAFEQGVNTSLAGMREDIGNAQAVVAQAVLVTGDQSIDGVKTFKQQPLVPIADIDEDPARVPVTVHNLKDLRARYEAKLLELQHSFEDEFAAMAARLDAQDSGNILWGYLDYSDPDNQSGMIPGTAYINYLTEDYQYIQLDKATNQPMDTSKTPFWRRLYVRDSLGKVTYTETRINPDLTGYAKLTGATFTGAVSVPDVPTATQDGRVFNAKQVHALIGEKLEEFNQTADFAQYAKLAGADFTGAVSVPNHTDALNAPSGTVLNKADTLKLIESGLENSEAEIQLVETLPSEDDLLPGRIYAEISAKME